MERNFKILKPEQFSLKGSSYDEKWLQEYIFDDPSCLGLGDDVRPIERERRQISGGRLDILLKDDDCDTLYEVEIMLGKTDESHIIRTIEYWDLERRKNPNYNHVAVIVAEEITNRFFNVISLLNNHVPIMAIQINPLLVENSLVINFVKILDLNTQAEIDDIENTEKENTNREYWKKRASEKSLNIADSVTQLCLGAGLKTEPKYNKYHIALSSSKNNFCWFHPRKSKSSCLTDIKIGKDNIPKIEKILKDTNIDFSHIKRGRGEKICVRLNSDILGTEKERIVDILKFAYEYCSQ